MTDQILLHERTDNQIKALLQSPPHAVMIIGPAGSGKRAVAKHIASQLLDVPLEKVDSQPYYVEITKPDGKSEIPIEAIRELIKSLRLKTAGRRRVVLIEGAHDLSEEAQNALLKAIEEPPDNTVFMLTTITQNSVLPTIASRSQKLNIYPVGQSEAHNHFNKFSASEIDSAWSLTRGSAGLLSAILHDKDGHEMKQAVSEAKLFLKMDQIERVIFLDKISTNKGDFIVFLDALSRVYAALSDAAIAKDNKSQLNKLVASRRLTYQAAESLSKNVSARLISLKLALSLSV